MTCVQTEMGVFEGRPGALVRSARLDLARGHRYEEAGRFVRWSLKHGGPGLPALSPMHYLLLAGRQLPNPLGNVEAAIRQIPDYEVQEKMEEVIYIHTCMHTYIHTRIHTHIHTYCTYIHINNEIHIYIHTYIHTYIHVYILIYEDIYSFTDQLLPLMCRLPSVSVQTHGLAGRDRCQYKRMWDSGSAPSAA